MLNIGNYDVIVVGGGNTALITALAAQQSGAQVLVLEKAPRAARGGNGYYTTGTYRCVHRGIEEVREIIPDLTEEEVTLNIPPYTADTFYNEIMRITEGMADPELLEVTIENSNGLIRWLKESLGIRFELPSVSLRRVDGHLLFLQGRNAFQVKGGGAGLSEALYGLIEQREIDLLYEAQALGLLVDTRGRVYGIRMRRKGDETQDIKSKAVILACGGFESNPAMRAIYLGKNWDICKVRGTKYNMGDGIRMALDAGAWPCGNWSGCHAVMIDADVVQPADREQTDITARMSHNYGILVNLNGERFLDEGADLASLTYAKYGQYVMAQPERIAFQVFDTKCESLLETRYATGSSITADSIEELEDSLGIEHGRLSKTIAEFNDSVKGSFDPSLRDGMHTRGIYPPKSNWAQKLDTPPFLAYPVTCGITFTYGGIQINGNAQVLTGNEPIPGLYAAGEIVGGLFYNNYSGGSGQLTGAVFGRIAGTKAADL